MPFEPELTKNQGQVEREKETRGTAPQCTGDGRFFHRRTCGKPGFAWPGCRPKKDLSEYGKQHVRKRPSPTID